MRELDRKASEVYGIPSLLLMENAGRAIADWICNRHKPTSAVIFCGKGNNGGDGLAVARHLWNRSWQVRIILLADPAVLKTEAQMNYQMAVKLGIPVQTSSAADADIVVDALLGIGTARPLDEPYLSAVHFINQSGKPVYAVDVPSGLNSDDGSVCGAAVRASTTLTLGLPKTGLSTGSGPAFSGTVEVLDIGLPKPLIDSLGKPPLDSPGPF